MVFIFLLSVIFAIRSESNDDSQIKVTILHTTDMHGWINGHLHEPELDADLGDLYNYIYWKKSRKDPNEIVLAFDTGDYTQGTGLSDATPVQGEFIFEQVKRIPYDGLCIGNHELRSNGCIDNIANNVAPFWRGKYLALNARHVDSSKQLGGKYFTIDLPNNVGKALVFGFLVSSCTHDTKSVLLTVSQSLKDPMFNQAFSTPNVSLIICLCHIDTPNPDVELIRKFMKSHKPNIPVVMLTGHSHLTRIETPTPDDYVMESGFYSNVIGNLQFHLSKSASKGRYFEPLVEMVDYTQSWVDMSKEALQQSAGFNSSSGWDTPMGSSIKAAIHKKVAELNLTRQIGCSPKHFSMFPKGFFFSSLYDFVLDTAFPKMFKKQQLDYVFSLPNLVFRYDLYKGPIVEDDLYAVDPFNYGLGVFPSVSAAHLKKVASLLGSTVFSSNLKKLADDEKVNFVFTTNEAANVQSKFEQVAPGQYKWNAVGTSVRTLFRDYVISNLKC